MVDASPAALYYNPGAIGLLDGQHLMIDSAFAWRTASYRRFPEAIDGSSLDTAEDAGFDREDAAAALSGRAELNDIVVLPFAGVVTDLGISRSPVRVGVAAFVPFGGQASWDEREASADFPGARDGSARWYSVEGTIRSLAGTFGVAYRIERPRLAFGVAGTLYRQEVETLRARNADASDNLVSSNGSLVEGRSLLDVSGTAVGVGGGVLWEALADTLWVGASYQSQPGFGTLELEGDLTNVLGAAPPAAPVDVVFTEELPDIARLGTRVRVSRAVELRLQMSWERWSELDQMCLATADVSDVDRACATAADGSLRNRELASDVVQVFQRDFRDTVGLRAGVSWFIDRLELLAGGAFDTNAIPDRRLDPALFDANKVVVALGAGYRFEHLALSLTVSNAFYFERDTRGARGNETLARPSRQPANEGVYRQNTLLLQPGVEVFF